MAIKGQPFTSVPLMRFSIGDIFADEGTVAAQGVLIGEPAVDLPPTNIIQEGDPFTITTWLKTAANGPWLTEALESGECFVNHHITNVDQNSVVGVFSGGAIVPVPSGDPPPNGATGPEPGESSYQWYVATSPEINLTRDTYRILTHVHADASSVYAQHLGAFLDGTMVHVLSG